MMKTTSDRIMPFAIVAFAIHVVGCAEPLEVTPVIGVSAYPVPRRAPPEFEDQDSDAIRLFYDVLAPYGEWSDDARLGLVWRPSDESVGERFVPYATHGRWTYREGQRPQSRDEYVWVSDLPWGWVPFHYGRWTLLPDRRWGWIPGRKYAGAWVDWRVPRELRESRDERVIVGWGPTPPSHLWRVVVGPRSTRTRIPMPIDPREAHLEAIPCALFAAPYVYAEAADLFANELSAALLGAKKALAASAESIASEPPNPEHLRLDKSALPSPPGLDRGLQQAWLLATPATASAVGAGPRLGAPPMLRTWAAGAERYVIR